MCMLSRARVSTTRPEALCSRRNAVAGLPWSPEGHVLVSRCQLGSSVGRTVKADSVPEVPGGTPGCAGCAIPGWKHTQKWLKRTHEEQITENEEMKRRRCDKETEAKEDVPVEEGDTSGIRRAREPEEIIARGAC